MGNAAGGNSDIAGIGVRSATDGLLLPSGGRTLASRMQEADAIRAWCNNLPRAKVTRWGGMISTPDADLQAQIRRSLADSGIPTTNGANGGTGQSQLLDDLMANAHERRWPPGLLTLETRQMNRRQYEQYVCRRVPGRQAVGLIFSLVLCRHAIKGEELHRIYGQQAVSSIGPGNEKPFNQSYGLDYRQVIDSRKSSSAETEEKD